MRCKRCKRVLSDPESVKRGMGEVCYSKSLMETSTKSGNATIVPYSGGDIYMKLLADGDIETNVQRKMIKHSPTGMSWGYLGSGCADMALNILLMFATEDFAYQHYQSFKSEIIAGIPKEGGTISLKSITDWISHKNNDV